jgi:hypothetical protein
MATPQRNNSIEKEGRIALALQALQKDTNQSIRAIARSYEIPESTLRTRYRGTQPKCEILSPLRKLKLSEETALVQWILNLDQRGFPPQIIDVRRMADTLLAARGENPPVRPVGKNWVSRFIDNHDELKIKWNRRFHSQRAKCEDPNTINAWFKLIQETRQSYGILDDDIYNFDETGFTMGVIATSKVVTSSETIGRATVVQPGNREWVTVIEGINASGWVIPPFVILAGKVHQSSWYQGLPYDWVIAVSNNGWTTDQLGYEWIKHFNKHTESRTKGTHRLLILDGHSSHATPEFDQYCTMNNIITLCMPAHTSHLLQPLDVSCFSPLKRSYGKEVQELVRQGIHHIDKEDFLAIYLKVQPLVFTEQNIKSGFKATGVIPYDPQRVLLSLTVTRTPSPPGTADGQAPQWTSETPRTIHQLEKQAQLVRDLIQRQSQSPTSQAVNQLVKGCQIALHSAVILTKEVSVLRTANKRRKKKQEHRRRFIAQGGVLQAQQGQDLTQVLENGEQEANQREASVVRQRAPPTCSNCHILGHTRRQCTNTSSNT